MPQAGVTKKTEASGNGYRFNKTAICLATVTGIQKAARCNETARRVPRRDEENVGSSGSWLGIRRRSSTKATPFAHHQGQEAHPKYQDFQEGAGLVNSPSSTKQATHDLEGSHKVRAYSEGMEYIEVLESSAKRAHLLFRQAALLPNSSRRGMHFFVFNDLGHGQLCTVT